LIGIILRRPTPSRIPQRCDGTGLHRLERRVPAERDADGHGDAEGEEDGVGETIVFHRASVETRSALLYGITLRTRRDRQRRRPARSR
jgi:hypothetical protein